MLHQEPVILQTPEGLDPQLSMDEVDCDLNEETGTLFNCDGAQTLKQLAEKIQIQELSYLAEAYHISSSQVDIDTTQNRIIVDD